MKHLIDFVFGREFWNADRVGDISSKAILCPRNDSCLEINHSILSKLPGAVVTFTSMDSTVSDDEDELNNYPIEFLNTLHPSGLPPHKLNLKKGAIVLLLKNLDFKKGLCNGTRLIVLNMTAYVIQVEIAAGKNKGHSALLSRIDMSPADDNIPVKLQRRQFPLSFPPCLCNDHQQVARSNV